MDCSSASSLCRRGGDARARHGRSVPAEVACRSRPTARQSNAAAALEDVSARAYDNYQEHTSAADDDHEHGSTAGAGPQAADAGSREDVAAEQAGCDLAPLTRIRTRD